MRVCELPGRKVRCPNCGHVGHRDREGAGNQLVGFLHRLRRGGDARPEYLCGPKDHMEECARRAPWRL